MSIDLTHCYVGPFGVTLTLVFGIYVFTRVLWVSCKFRNAEVVQGYLDSFSVCRRTDLPEADLTRIPEALQNSGIQASANFEWRGREYRTRLVTYWDFVGLSNYSHCISERLRKQYESGGEINLIVNRENPRISVIVPTFSGFAIIEMAIVLLGGAVLAWFASECLSALSAGEVLVTSFIGGVGALIGVVACLVRANNRINGKDL